MATRVSAEKQSLGQRKNAPSRFANYGRVSASGIGTATSASSVAKFLDGDGPANKPMQISA